MQPYKQPAGGAVTQVFGLIVPESSMKNGHCEIVESPFIVLTPTKKKKFVVYRELREFLVGKSDFNSLFDRS